MTPHQLAFFQKYLSEFFEFWFRGSQVINWRTCHHHMSWCKSEEAQPYAERLFADREVVIPEMELSMQLVTLREMNGKEFFHINVLPTKRKLRRRTKCFLGNRFLPGIERTLRWNLRTILEPYDVEVVDWSGRNPRGVQILGNILSMIKDEADFCIFDNRATKDKPNVYIEAGMCIALEVPFVLFRLQAGPDTSGRSRRSPLRLRGNARPAVQELQPAVPRLLFSLARIF